MAMVMLRCFVFVVMAIAARAVMPKIVVDLDEEPEIRWAAVAKYYEESGILEAVLGKQTGPAVPEELALNWYDAVKDQVDDEYLREIDGWANFLNKTADKNFTRSFILAQYMYDMNWPEAATACSGVLAAMPNGTVIQGRNLDYGDFEITLNGKKASWPEVTIEVTMLRGGKPLYTSIIFPGQIGVSTAMRFDGWSIQQNTRRTGDDTELNLAAARQGGLGFGLYTRRLMESVPDFETAVEKLSLAKFAATHYFVLAGPKPYQGIVLSIDRMGQHLPDSPITNLNQHGKWHIVQTNDDIGERPSDPRRPLEEQALNSASQSQVNPTWVFNQMRSGALFNPATVFTWIAVPATGFSKAILRFDNWPEETDAAFHKKSKSFLSRFLAKP